MSKQLLIYESAIPVSSARHRTASVEAQKGYGFSAGINAVPLMAVEFLRAASEYAIVFTRSTSPSASSCVRYGPARSAHFGPSIADT